uniref:Putative secreted protein n=1 Tax=Lutzomyia longipalpis TaxID=7200 RepID=A0A7G3AM13_LUTLO
MPALNVAHLLSTSSLCGAESSSCVVDNNEGSWNTWKGSSIGIPGTPLSTCNDCWARSLGSSKGHTQHGESSKEAIHVYGKLHE